MDEVFIISHMISIDLIWMRFHGFTYGLFTNFMDDFPHQTSRERFQELATFDSGG